MLKPLFDRVLCEPIGERTTESGIYIPTTAAERSQIMTVVAVGQNPPVSAGDKIVVNKYSGAEVCIAGKKQYIVKNIDIIGVINETK